MVMLFDRAINKAIREYRKHIFRKRIGCTHKEISLVGKVYLINTNITLGKNVTIYPDVMFFGDGPIVIGDNVDIGNNTIIYSSKNAGVWIGDNTMLAAHSYIIDTDHGTQIGTLIREQNNKTSPVSIGNDVWIGTNVTILRGSTIGDGAVIGAKALVKNEISENAIAVGIPARIIGYRE